MGDLWRRRFLLERDSFDEPVDAEEHVLERKSLDPVDRLPLAEEEEPTSTLPLADWCSMLPEEYWDDIESEEEEEDDPVEEADVDRRDLSS